MKHPITISFEKDNLSKANEKRDTEITYKK